MDNTMIEVHYTAHFWETLYQHYDEMYQTPGMTMQDKKYFAGQQMFCVQMHSMLVDFSEVVADLPITKF